MTKEDIIRIANEVYGIEPGDKQLHPSALVHLELFAKLVAEHEREACAKTAWDIVQYEVCADLADQVAQAIRARGKE